MNSNDQFRPNTPSGRRGRAFGGSNKKMVLVVAGVVLAVGLAVVLFAVLSSGKTDGNSADDAAAINNAAERSSQTAGSSTDMGSLNSVTFNAPDMNGYEKQERSGDAFSNYITEDGKCAIVFGTFSPLDVPGASVEDIVSQQLEDLRGGGSAIDGPDAGDALVVKDAADGAKTYRMPTLNFKLSKDDTRVYTRYSVAILSGGDRAVVSRECADTEGNEIPQSRLDELDAKAGELTVIVKP